MSESLEKKLMQLLEELHKAKKLLPPKKVAPPAAGPKNVVPDVEDNPSKLSHGDVKRLTKKESVEIAKNGQWAMKSDEE